MLWLLAVVPILGAALPPALSARSARLLPTLASTVVLLATLMLAALAVRYGWSGEWSWGRDIRLVAGLDPVSRAMVLLVPAVAFPVVLFAGLHEARPGLGRLLGLLLFFVGAMELLVVAGDLLTLLMGWELVGACSWALIGHDWRHPGPPRDASIAFLVTRFGDLGLFLAAMITFAATGSFAFAALERANAVALELATLGILIAAAAKSAQVPFSLWLFNAMSGPSSASALLHAATMVAAGAYLLARLHPTLEGVSWFGAAAMTVGVITALAGGVVAVLQAHVKKLLAASTSAQFGLMFVAVGAGYPALAMLHLVAHAWFKSLLFLAAGVASTTRYTHLLALMGYGRRLTATAVLALCGSMALAGLPPFGAAWSKELITAAAGHHGAWFAWSVLIAGSLSAAYAARWQWLALGPGELAREAERARQPPAVHAALGLAALLTVLTAAIWLPPLHELVISWLGGELPTPQLSERVASLLLVAAGLYTGRWLALTNPHLGRRRRTAAAAEWLGLPLLLERGVERPARRLARAAADFDDRVIDGTTTATARRAIQLAQAAGRADVAGLDGAVRGLANLATALGRYSAGLVEAIVDGVAEGAARLTGNAGRDTARLESGLAHHYLAWIAIGAALLAMSVLLGI